MAAQLLEASVRRADGLAIIDLRGDIDGTTEETLNAAYAEAASTRPAAIALNFGGVEYINSTGIALIVGVLAQARKAKLPISTFGLSEHYKEIFQITRLSDFMHIYANEADAVGKTSNAKAQRD